MTVPHTNLLACVVDDRQTLPRLSGFSVGYESELWRMEDFASAIFDELPSFALPHADYASLSADTAMRLLRRAAQNIYTTDKYKRRGEFGELILHTLLRRHFKTLPAVSKVYYKDSPNDTVKGFDAVHVVATQQDLELWLGEVKFYGSASDAIRDVIKELHAHSTREYLRTEFPAIVAKIDPSWPHADRLARLITPDVSLDAVFDTAKFPVLLTYDSATVSSHTSVCDAYLAAFEQELRGHHASFCGAGPPAKLEIELLLLPLHSKADLVAHLDSRLRAWQAL